MRAQQPFTASPFNCACAILLTTLLLIDFPILLLGPNFHHEKTTLYHLALTSPSQTSTKLYETDLIQLHRGIVTLNGVPTGAFASTGISQASRTRLARLVLWDPALKTSFQIQEQKLLHDILMVSKSNKDLVAADTQFCSAELFAHYEAVSAIFTMKERIQDGSAPLWSNFALWFWLR